MATPTRTIGSTRDKRPARPSTAAVSRRIEAKPSAPPSANPPANGKPEPKILFQKFFHSVGPRTYAAQVKELPNRNHLLVLTEGKRDRETGEVRKTRLFVYGEDFSAFCTKRPASFAPIPFPRKSARNEASSGRRRIGRIRGRFLKEHN